MPEWVDDSPYSPAVTFTDGVNLGGARRQSMKEYRVWVRYRQDHSNATAFERLGTEVAVLGRFIANPELRSSDGEPRYNARVWPIKSVDLNRAECGLVKLDRFRTLFETESHGVSEQDVSVPFAGSEFIDPSSGGMFISPIFYRLPGIEKGLSARRSGRSLSEVT